MALSLFYILTAHHETDSAFDAETQQKLMGYALKTLHDFPVITDQTRIDGTFILDPDLRGSDNTLQVILRPVSPEDAIAFWNSQETRTTRLSAYYEVRVVTARAGKTTDHARHRAEPRHVSGAHGRAASRPQPEPGALQDPGKNGGTVQQVEATPARVTLDSSASPRRPTIGSCCSAPTWLRANRGCCF